MYDEIVTLKKDGVEICKCSLRTVDKILYDYAEGYIEGENGKTAEDMVCSLLGISPSITAPELLAMRATVQERKEAVWHTKAKTAVITDEGAKALPDPVPVEEIQIPTQRMNKSEWTGKRGFDPMTVTPEEAVTLRRIAYMIAYVLDDLNPDWGDYVELQGGCPESVIKQRRADRNRRR